MAESERTKASNADRAVILKAIAAVRNECGRIEKDGYNAFHKYSYVSESALVNAARPLMAKHGLVIIPSLAADYEPRVDECGVTHMIMEFTLAHESGAVWPEKARIFCSGNDRDSKGNYGDKGAYKANTGGYKYFLNRLFMVDTGDDPERGKDKAKPKAKAPAGSTGDVPRSSSQGSAGSATLANPNQIKMLSAKGYARAEVLTGESGNHAMCGSIVKAAMRLLGFEDKKQITAVSIDAMVKAIDGAILDPEDEAHAMIPEEKF